MELNFKRISLDMSDSYMGLWNRTPERSSDHSFCILWSWDLDRHYHLAFEEQEALCWIKEARPVENYLAPIGQWERSDWKNIIKARFGAGTHTFHLVPKGLAEIWRVQLDGCVEITENRGSFEYLHRVEELATLKGNKYMRKRNRVNQFQKQTPYEYLPITPDTRSRVAAFQQEWCEQNSCVSIQGLKAENEGILRVLNDWDAIPHLLGGMLESGGKVIAYTIAEDVGDKTLMIHFEKASIEYHAAYQVINRDFLAHSAQGYEIVNREEDMDDPGLRDAKMSYHPYSFLEKCTVVIRL